MKMPFGIHAGKELTEIPTDYLRWIGSQEWVENWLVKAINDVLAEDLVPSDGLRTFSFRQSGHIGQEILDADGSIIAWTTDEWIAQVLCQLLNENETLVTRA